MTSALPNTFICRSESQRSRQRSAYDLHFIYIYNYFTNTAYFAKKFLKKHFAINGVNLATTVVHTVGSFILLIAEDYKRT